jgi:hypothetical protein
MRPALEVGIRVPVSAVNLSTIWVLRRLSISLAPLFIGHG